MSESAGPDLPPYRYKWEESFERRTGYTPEDLCLDDAEQAMNWLKLVNGWYSLAEYATDRGIGLRVREAAISRYNWLRAELLVKPTPFKGLSKAEIWQELDRQAREQDSEESSSWAGQGRSGWQYTNYCGFRYTGILEHHLEYEPFIPVEYDDEPEPDQDVIVALRELSALDLKGNHARRQTPNLHRPRKGQPDHP